MYKKILSTVDPQAISGKVHDMVMLAASQIFRSKMRFQLFGEHVSYFRV